MDVTSSAQAKKVLRELSLSRRKSEPKSNIKSNSQKIANRFFKTTTYKRSKVIACYLSFGSEVQTSSIVSRIWKDKKILLIPDTRKGFSNSRFVRYEKGDSLKKTRHGMNELRNSKSGFNFSKIGVVLVPGLSFDRGGYRLGFGSGVYDRLMKKSRKAKHVGLFFKFQQLHRLPHDSWDQPMDQIITD